MEFISRNDAVQAIKNLIAEADITLDGRNPADAYDLDAIADEVLTTSGAGCQYRYVLEDEGDGLWAAMARHAH